MTANPIIPGIYWFKGTLSGKRVRSVVEVKSDGRGYSYWVVYFSTAAMYDTEWDWLSAAEGEWWGPLMPPWDNAEND